jgi:hypothetical protein
VRKSNLKLAPKSDLAAELDLVTEQAVADLRRVKISALRNERCLGDGPPFVKFGNKVFYRRSDLLAWIKANTVKPTPAPTLISSRRGARVQS